MTSAILLPERILSSPLSQCPFCVRLESVPCILLRPLLCCSLFYVTLVVSSLLLINMLRSQWKDVHSLCSSSSSVYSTAALLWGNILFLFLTCPLVQWLWPLFTVPFAFPWQEHWLRVNKSSCAHRGTYPGLFLQGRLCKGGYLESFCQWPCGQLCLTLDFVIWRATCLQIGASHQFLGNMCWPPPTNSFTLFLSWSKRTGKRGGIYWPPQKPFQKGPLKG